MDSEEQSQMFKVDHSEEYEVPKNREENFFDKDKVIIQPGQKRKVIYGNMDEEEKTIYEILQPYLWKMAQSTGGMATKIGQGVFNALWTGAGWAYDKIINSVIPYTAQQIPKMLFVVTKQENKQPYQSDAFQVIEVDDPQYEAIKNKKSTQKKKRVIVPLDKNYDPKIAQILAEDKSFVMSTDFPIDMESQQQTLLVPSASFVVLHDEVTKNMKVEEKIETELEPVKELSAQQQVEEEKSEKKIQYSYKMPEAQKTTYYKMKDCYIFEYEGQNTIQYDLLDGIEKHDKTQKGYLLFPQKVIKSNISSDSNESFSGEVPLLVANEDDVTQLGNRKVKVEIPTDVKYVEKEKKKEEKLQLA